MKTFFLTAVLCLLGILIGCQKGDETSGYKVSGLLKSGGIPLGNASVDIDGLVQYKTSTNSDGYFLLEDIPAGNHSLNIQRRNTDNSFIQKSYDILLQEKDLNLQSLILPNPVLIDTIMLDSVTNSATIKWNQSTAEDFREYKLYSHTTSGLDETTGKLEHVTIDIKDTVKSIQLENLTKKYFRVFVLNEYDQLGGSNILSIYSINRNLIPGGNFDDSEDLDQWTVQGNITISSNEMFAGSGSVLLKSEIDTIDNNISGSIDRWPVARNEMSIPVALEANRDYKISFMYKLSGLAYMMYPFEFYFHQNDKGKVSTTLYYNWSGEMIPLSPFKILDDTGWLHYSKVFTSDSDSYAEFHIITQIENVWIDNLEIKIVE